MQACEQTKGLSVYEHGVSVFEHFLEFQSFLCKLSDLPDWKIPTWLHTYRIQIQEALLPTETISVYMIYHDCGKPFCRTVDETYRVHFPNHAQVSANVWKACGGSEQEAKLMAMDMHVHTMKAAEIDEFIKHPEAITLLVAAFCEIHANANMFGGIDSTSFKIKWKQIDKRGKAICKKLFGE